MTTTRERMEWFKGRALAAERQLAAAVDELTDAQQENARLAALIVEAYDQRDAAQAALQQADERQRQAERAAVVKALRAYGGNRFVDQFTDEIEREERAW